MSKNLTRKSLALGAATALVLTGFSAIPANAAGQADTTFVALAPSAGSEYSVLSGNSKEFTLTANEATSIVGGSMSFLVKDGANGVEPKASETTGYTIAAVDDWSAAAGANTLTISEAGHKLVNGDVVTITGLQYATEVGSDGTGGDTLNQSFATAAASYVVSGVVANTSFVISITHSIDVVAGIANTVNYSDNNEGVVELVRSIRSTVDGSYVVESGIASSGSDENLTLVTSSSETATRSIQVTAWVDANGNRLIDTTEYVSPTRTVQFIKASEVVASTSLTYPTPGDTSLTATVTLTPNLNEQQDMAATDVKIGFTRPGSTATVAVDATQDDTTRVWSASQSLATGFWAGMPHIQGLTLSALTTNVVTITTGAAHGIAVGDFIIVDGSQGIDVATTTEVASVPSTTTLTYAKTAANIGSAADTGFVRVVSRDLTDTGATATVKTYQTDTAHGLTIGDLVTVAASNAAANATRAAVASVPSSTTFTIAGTGFTPLGADTVDTGQVTYVSYTEAVAGTYSAKAQVSSVAQGNTATNFAVATTSDDVSLATTATANVQAASNNEVTANVSSAIRKGELSVELTATVVDSNDVAVTAGRPVVVALGALDTGSAALVGTYTINGTAYASAVTLLTDANGKVVFTVGENDGAVGSKVEITVTPENLSGAQTADLELTWAAPVFGIWDLNDSADLATTGNNSITAGGNYTYSLAVLDQWKAAPAAGTHRVKYATTNRTVATNYLTLTDGRASYTVADGAISGQTNIATAFSLEELQTDATWAANETLLQTGTSLTYTTSVVAATQVDAVLLDTDGSTAYGNDVADLSNAAGTTALVAQDRRLVNGSRPAYGNDVIVSGRVSNATTNVPRAGTVVTLSGPNSILFGEGSVDALGGVTIKTDANGEFSVKLFSITSQTNAIITVTSGASSKTVKVTFTGPGASFGTAIEIDAPTSVMPGTSFKVTATLRDKNGNAVQSTTGDVMKVEYSGPGIVIAAMPTDTNTLGQVSFVVLLGTNDKGTGVVTVSYDQGNDDDFTGTATGDLDVIATKSLTVGAVASSDTKVNVGTFKGFVALYAKGYEGQKMSAIVAGKWIVVASLASDFERVVRFTGAGYTITTKIYIDGEQVGDAFTTVTK
jgi:hypothetical protein